MLDEPRSYGQGYNVGCDDVLTNDQMLDVAAEVLGRPHPVKVHVPRGLLVAIAPLLERSGKLAKGAVRGLLDSMAADLTGDPTPIRAILPRPPLSYRQAVERAVAAGASAPAAPARATAVTP